MSTLFGKTKRKRSNRKPSPSLSPPSNTVDGDDTAKISGNDTTNKLLLQNNNGPEIIVHNNSNSNYVNDPSNRFLSFSELGLAEPLVQTCKSLGFQKPSPVQRTVIPFLLQKKNNNNNDNNNDPPAHVLALAATGSGKTAAFCLPIIHQLSLDPYGIYAVIVSPTRELAKQIHQQVLALGSAYNVQSTLVVGGLNMVHQSCELDSKKPHFVVATPGRLAELLRGPNPPRLEHVRYLVLDEADRLLAANSGFERDVAELLLHCNNNNRRKTKCQTLLFSATMTRSLESLETLAGAGQKRIKLHKFVIKEDDEGDNDNDLKPAAAKKQKTNNDNNNNDGNQDDNDSSGDDSDTDSGDDGDDDIDDDQKDNIQHQHSGESSEERGTTPKIPAGLKQEYVFMPSRVRDAYLLTTVRTLMANGGRVKKGGWNDSDNNNDENDEANDENVTTTTTTTTSLARSAIVFVSTCERAALVSGIFTQVGVENVALHSLLSQNRRLAALGKFKSQQVRVLVATDVASRGLDIPTVDLVINSELPRNPTCYIHRVGRTARAGRRGRAISLVAESDVSLVHAAERTSGRPLEKCTGITDDAAIRLLGPVTKAARLAKMKLMEIGFDELVQKFKERKVRDRKERQRIERALKKQSSKSNKKK